MVSVAPGLCSFLGPPSEKRQTAGCRKEAHWNWKVAKLPIADSIAARQGIAGVDLRLGREFGCGVSKTRCYSDSLSKDPILVLEFIVLFVRPGTMDIRP